MCVTGAAEAGQRSRGIIGFARTSWRLTYTLDSTESEITSVTGTTASRTLAFLCTSGKPPDNVSETADKVWNGLHPEARLLISTTRPPRAGSITVDSSQRSNVRFWDTHGNVVPTDAERAGGPRHRGERHKEITRSCLSYVRLAHPRAMLQPTSAHEFCGGTRGIK
ncbi:unnamed protein product, partial [Pleuronectes platessa]